MDGWMDGKMTCVGGCVGEWSRRQRRGVGDFHWSHLPASSLVNRQRRSRTCGWLAESSRHTAEQSTISSSHRRRREVSSQAVAARTTLSQWTHITAVCSTQQQQQWAVATWHHLAIHSTMIDRLISVQYNTIQYSFIMAWQNPSYTTIIRTDKNGEQ